MRTGVATARDKKHYRSVPLAKTEWRSVSITTKDSIMDKDRIAGAGKQLKGNIKEAAGKVTGDKKLETEGKADKVEGKVQNAVGGLKDAARDALKDR